LLVLPSIVWIALDRAVWPWDQAWYGEVSLDLWSTLVDAPRSWPNAMTNAFGSKAPGVAWLGQFFLPLGPFVGDQRALLASVVACQIASLALLFASARSLEAGLAASLVGALVLGASPLFVWTTHEYLAEGLLILTVAWSLLLLALAGRSDNPIALAAQLPGLAAVSMLAKVSSPLYLALPICATVALLVPQLRNGATHLRHWLRSSATIVAGLASTLAVLGTARWYRVNLDATLEQARIAREDNGLYGSQRGLGAELSEWTNRMTDATFLPLVASGIGVVVVVALGYKLVRGPRRRPGRSMLVGGMCVLQSTLVVVAFATQPNEDARFLLPAVPFVALAISLAVAHTPRVVVGVAIALLSVELMFVTLQGFGSAPIERLSYYRLAAPQRDPTVRNALERLVDLTCTDDSIDRVMVVGAEQPSFNANTLAMMASARNSRVARKCSYTSLGYAESDTTRAWRRVVDLKPAFYLAIDYGRGGRELPAELEPALVRTDAFNRVNRAIFRRVERSPLFAVVPGSARNGFVVFKWVGPV
jgi:hypothetical protein